MSTTANTPLPVKIMSPARSDLPVRVRCNLDLGPSVDALGGDLLLWSMLKSAGEDWVGALFAPTHFQILHTLIGHPPFGVTQMASLIVQVDPTTVMKRLINNHFASVMSRFYLQASKDVLSGRATDTAAGEYLTDDEQWRSFVHRATKMVTTAIVSDAKALTATTTAATAVRSTVQDTMRTTSMTLGNPEGVSGALIELAAVTPWLYGPTLGAPRMSLSRAQAYAAARCTPSEAQAWETMPRKQRPTLAALMSLSALHSTA